MPAGAMPVDGAREAMRPAPPPRGHTPSLRNHSPGLLEAPIPLSSDSAVTIDDRVTGWDVPAGGLCTDRTQPCIDQQVTNSPQVADALAWVEPLVHLQHGVLRRVGRVAPLLFPGRRVPGPERDGVRGVIGEIDTQVQPP